ncbi:DciA family protein [Streptomyces sp. NPDC004296]|uniref:DciA family protein n=1 Tax=Streptomyces sp. NPDC004296 TaxID=3364697 RepID=UPI0036C1DF53
MALSTVLLDLIISRTGWGAPGFDVLSRWPALVGEAVAENLPAVNFDSATGTLYLRPVSRAWATQARLLLKPLSAKLACDLGEGVVRNIRLLPAGAASDLRTPAAGIPPQVRRSARLGTDAYLDAAVERQARQALREPTGHLPSHQLAGGATRSDLVRARAVARARGQQATESHPSRPRAAAR